MKTLIIVCMFLGIAAQQPMPPPGNPNHVTPAPGQYCTHNPKDGAHNCQCHRRCVPNIDERGNPAPGEHVQEDYATCRASCKEDHCHCRLEGCS